MKKLVKLTFFILLPAVILSYIWLFDSNISATIKDFSQRVSQSIIPALPQIKTDTKKEVAIAEGATYGVLMDEAGIAYEISSTIYNAAKPVYDLAKIRCGRCLDLIYDNDTDELKELTYQIDSEEKLSVQKICSTTEEAVGTGHCPVPTASSSCAWFATTTPIIYEIKTKTAAGTVETSLYQAAMDNDFDIRAIIELANAFQWTIDFAMDPRVGDTFKFIYEERYLDGKYIMPGGILAGKYINAGAEHRLYYFAESKDNTGFFDADGNSVQKMFLKAPVAYKYISSGYTTGPRYVGGQYQIFTSSHRAIDYAAPIGTPIRAVGDGTITFAGWNKSGYGYFTNLHHNATYSTNYAHQSRIIVKRGQKVKQGDIIGYVGSTGFSTGPHLHYEMVKHGDKINPLREILPPGKPIKEKNKKRFFTAIRPYQEMLDIN